MDATRERLVRNGLMDGRGPVVLTMWSKTARGYFGLFIRSLTVPICFSFGLWFSRQFNDAPEEVKRKDARSLRDAIHLHNKATGRAVSLRMRIEVQTIRRNYVSSNNQHHLFEKFPNDVSQTR